MPEPSNAELQNRFSRVAIEAAFERQLTLNPSGQNALGALVAIAADVLEGSDEDEVQRAEQSFRLLAATLASSGTKEGALEELTLERRPQSLIGEREVQAGLRDLCPGFWPFC
jgi:hypothetical protein